MKAAIINRSDSTGGAAVVSRRLCEALRRQGVDARMIVVEKLTDYDWVIPAVSPKHAMIPFLKERLEIFVRNGFNRQTLFQIDTASTGLPIHKIPFVREADVICLNWVNQGMLSIKGIRKLLSTGKPVVWTMHDMWCMTGICHHAGECKRFIKDGECGNCPLLGQKASPKDISKQTFLRKLPVWNGVEVKGGKEKKLNRIHFVAVSNWLAELARKSTLLNAAPLSTIPNAFPIDCKTAPIPSPQKLELKKRIVFGAARLDDPVKGLPTLIAATQFLSDIYPDIAKNLELITFGGLKDPNALDDIAINHTHLGKIPPSKIREVYESANIVVSTSEWETLPGTLIEGQAWGCVPVALDHGGQSDIIEHLHTGYLASYSEDPQENAVSIAEGIIWASQAPEEVRRDMYKSVCDRFSEEAVAKKYLNLFKTL